MQVYHDDTKLKQLRADVEAKGMNLTYIPFRAPKNGNFLTKRYWFRRVLCFFGKHLNAHWRPFDFDTSKFGQEYLECHDCGTLKRRKIK